jgi:hypothetical protein
MCQEETPDPQNQDVPAHKHLMQPSQTPDHPRYEDEGNKRERL